MTTDFAPYLCPAGAAPTAALAAAACGPAARYAAWRLRDNAGIHPDRYLFAALAERGLSAGSLRPDYADVWRSELEEVHPDGLALRYGVRVVWLGPEEPAEGTDAATPEEAPDDARGPEEPDAVASPGAARPVHRELPGNRGAAADGAAAGTALAGADAGRVAAGAMPPLAVDEDTPGAPGGPVPGVRGAAGDRGNPPEGAGAQTPEPASARLRRDGWPRLSEDLNGPRAPDRCQACGGVSDLGIWREHDRRDRPDNVFLVLCAPCADRLVPPHKRLYSDLDSNAPVAGCMLLCLGCVHRDGVTCRRPAAMANGGTGIKITCDTPQYVHFSVTTKGGKRTGWSEVHYRTPPSACSGYEGGATVPIPFATEEAPKPDTRREASKGTETAPFVKQCAAEEAEAPAVYRDGAERTPSEAILRRLEPTYYVVAFVSARDGSVTLASGWAKETGDLETTNDPDRVGFWTDPAAALAYVDALDWRRDGPQYCRGRNVFAFVHQIAPRQVRSRAAAGWLNGVPMEGPRGGNITELAPVITQPAGNITETAPDIPAAHTNGHAHAHATGAGLADCARVRYCPGGAIGEKRWGTREQVATWTAADARYLAVVRPYSTNPRSWCEPHTGPCPVSCWRWEKAPEANGHEVHHRGSDVRQLRTDRQAAGDAASDRGVDQAGGTPVGEGTPGADRAGVDVRGQAERGRAGLPGYGGPLPGLPAADVSEAPTEKSRRAAARRARKDEWNAAAKGLMAAAAGGQMTLFAEED